MLALCAEGIMPTAMLALCAEASTRKDLMPMDGHERDSHTSRTDNAIAISTQCVELSDCHREAMTERYLPIYLSILSYLSIYLSMCLCIYKSKEKIPEYQKIEKQKRNKKI